jgi:hypothetical protein
VDEISALQILLNTHVYSIWITCKKAFINIKMVLYNTEVMTSQNLKI